MPARRVLSSQGHVAPGDRNGAIWIAGVGPVIAAADDRIRPSWSAAVAWARRRRWNACIGTALDSRAAVRALLMAVAVG